jgi:DUF4097 and DUF4098 domain-containing protein YvlB
MFKQSMFVALFLNAAGLAGPMAAQQGGGLSCRGSDDRDDWGERFCSIEKRTIRAGGLIRVEAQPNGGVTVIGTDGNEIQLTALIQARGRTEDRARDLGGSVRIVLDGTRIGAEGPKTANRENWSVSFELRVPRTSDLWIRSQNGGIYVTDVSGEMDLGTVNGGLTLNGLSGDVLAETTNGGVDVTLEGRRWQGAGLTVRTVNGGVELSIPDRYSAELEAGTVNGGLDFDFPISVRGRLNRRVSATLGDGGPPIRVTTTNGGVSVRRS